MTNNEKTNVAYETTDARRTIKNELQRRNRIGTVSRTTAECLKLHYVTLSVRENRMSSTNSKIWQQLKNIKVSTASSGSSLCVPYWQREIKSCLRSFSKYAYSEYPWPLLSDQDHCPSFSNTEGISKRIAKAQTQRMCGMVYAFALRICQENTFSPEAAHLNTFMTNSNVVDLSANVTNAHIQSIAHIFAIRIMLCSWSFDAI